MGKKFFEKLLPKKEDLYLKTLGSITKEWVKCGKKCKCSSGKLHGPYYYRRFRVYENGCWKQKKEYIKHISLKKLKKRIEEVQLLKKNIADFNKETIRKLALFNQKKTNFIL